MDTPKVRAKYNWWSGTWDYYVGWPDPRFAPAKCDSWKLAVDVGIAWMQQRANG